MHVAGQLDFAEGGGNVQRSLEAERRRDVVEKVVERFDPDLGQHGLLVVGGVENVGQTYLQNQFTTKTQGTQRMHKEKSLCPLCLCGELPLNVLPKRSVFRIDPASSGCRGFGRARSLF